MLIYIYVHYCCRHIPIATIELCCRTPLHISCCCMSLIVPRVRAWYMELCKSPPYRNNRLYRTASSRQVGCQTLLYAVASVDIQYLYFLPSVRDGLPHDYGKNPHLSPLSEIRCGFEKSQCAPACTACNFGVSRGYVLGFYGTAVQRTLTPCWLLQAVSRLRNSRRYSIL